MKTNHLHCGSGDSSKGYISGVTGTAFAKGPPRGSLGDSGGVSIGVHGLICSCSCDSCTRCWTFTAISCTSISTSMASMSDNEIIQSGPSNADWWMPLLISASSPSNGCISWSGSSSCFSTAWACESDPNCNETELSYPESLFLVNLVFGQNQFSCKI